MAYLVVVDNPLDDLQFFLYQVKGYCSSQKSHLNQLNLIALSFRLTEEELNTSRGEYHVAKAKQRKDKAIENAKEKTLIYLLAL